MAGRDRKLTPQDKGRRVAADPQHPWRKQDRDWARKRRERAGDKGKPK